MATETDKVRVFKNALIRAHKKNLQEKLQKQSEEEITKVHAQAEKDIEDLNLTSEKDFFALIVLK